MANTRCCPPRSREFQSKRSFFLRNSAYVFFFPLSLGRARVLLFQFSFFSSSFSSFDIFLGQQHLLFSRRISGQQRLLRCALLQSKRFFLFFSVYPFLLLPLSAGGEGFRIQMTNHSSKLGGSRPTAAQFRRHVRRTEESESAPPAHDPSPVSPLPSSSVSGLSARRRKGTVPSPIFFGFMFSPSFTSSSLLVFLTAKRENGERCVESAACLSGSVYLTIDWNRGRENQEGQLFYIVALLFLFPLSRPKLTPFFLAKNVRDSLPARNSTGFFLFLSGLLATERENWN